MNILPISSNQQNSSFKAITTIRIPKTVNTKKFIVEIDHTDKDFVFEKWQKVRIYGLERGKRVLQKEISDEHFYFSFEKIAQTEEYINKLANYKGDSTALSENYFKQRRFEDITK